MVLYEANLRWKVSICVNKISTNFQVKPVLQTKKTLQKRSRRIKLCILTLWAPNSCESNIYLDLCNILKFHCVRITYRQGQVQWRTQKISEGGKVSSQ